jgi:hypothetical protein
MSHRAKDEGSIYQRPTLRIYSHVLPSMQEQAAGAMDRLFGTAKIGMS